MLQMPPRVSRRSAYRTAELPIQHHTGFIPWRGYAHHHHRCSSHTYNPFPAQQLLHPGLLPFSDLCEWAAAAIGKEELTKHNICRLIIPFVYLPLPQTRPTFSSILISDHQEAPLSRPMAHSLHLLPLQHLGFNPFHQLLHQLYLGFMRSSGGLDGCHICRV